MALVVVILPTYVCNLACTYCYNEGERKGVMNRDTLRGMITELNKYALLHPEQGGVEFLWHGGEPMVAGIKFFEEAVAIQRAMEWPLPYKNRMQSNGLLLDDAWISFLRLNEFTISFSLDGPMEINDRTRVDHKGRGAHTRVLAAYRAANAAGIATGVVVTLTSANAPHAAEIYRYFAKETIPFAIIPLLQAGNAKNNFEDLSISPEAYLQAWIIMYDLWLARDPYVPVASFIYETKAVLMGKPYICFGHANCANTTMSVEPNGDVYPCGSMTANPDNFYGNLLEAPLDDVMQSANAVRLRTRKHADDCLSCKWFHTCHGGCMSRALKYTGSIDNKDYYCHALFGMYEHIEKRIGENGLRAGLPHPSHLDNEVALPSLQSRAVARRRAIIPIATIGPT